MGQAKIPMVSSLRALATLAVLLAVSWELGSATSEVDTTDVISDVAQLLSKNPNIQDDADDGSIAQIKQALSSEKASQEKVTNPKEDAVWTDETKEDTTNLDQNDAPEEDMLGDGDGADSVAGGGAGFWRRRRRTSYRRRRTRRRRRTARRRRTCVACKKKNRRQKQKIKRQKKQINTLKKKNRQRLRRKKQKIKQLKYRLNAGKRKARKAREKIKERKAKKHANRDTDKGRALKRLKRARYRQRRAKKAEKRK